MSLSKVFGASHLEQARGGAVELEAFRSPSFDQEILRHGCRRHEKPDRVVVERVYQNDEALGLVPFFRTHLRNMVDKDRIEAIRDRQEVRGAERSLA